MPRVAGHEAALSRAMRSFAHRLNRRVLRSDRRPDPTPADRRDPWRDRVGSTASTRLP